MLLFFSINCLFFQSGCLDQAKLGSPPGAGGEGADAGPPPPAPAPAPVFDRVPPPLEWQTRRPERRGWHILALHPIEVARQLTLLEFDMYRTVSEFFSFFVIFRLKIKKCLYHLPTILEDLLKVFFM